VGDPSLPVDIFLTLRTFRPQTLRVFFRSWGPFVPEEFVLRVFGCVIRMLSSFVDVMADRGG
jgi:hypothetical protein